MVSRYLTKLEMLEELIQNIDSFPQLHDKIEGIDFVIYIDQFVEKVHKIA